MVFSIGVLIVQVMAACSGSNDHREAIRTSLTMRFIEHDPGVFLEDSDLISSVGLFSWEAGAESSLWPEEHAVARMQLGERTVVPRFKTHRVAILIEAAIAADTVDTIEVVLEREEPGKTRTGPLALYWAPVGKAFTAECHQVVKLGTLIEDNRRRYRFSPRGHPGWLEEVRLRLDLIPPHEEGVEGIRLITVEGFGRSINPHCPPEVINHGTKVGLGEQTRNALPALPDTPIDRELSIPANAELRFAIGLQKGVTAPVRFEVVFSTPGDSRAVIFNRSLQPRESDRWHDCRVDLSELAGATGRIVLLCESADASCRRIGFWADPTVIAATK